MEATPPPSNQDEPNPTPEAEGEGAEPPSMDELKLFAQEDRLAMIWRERDRKRARVDAAARRQHDSRRMKQQIATQLAAVNRNAAHLPVRDNLVLSARALEVGGGVCGGGRQGCPCVATWSCRPGPSR